MVWLAVGASLLFTNLSLKCGPCYPVICRSVMYCEKMGQDLVHPSTVLSASKDKYIHKYTFYPSEIYFL